MLPLDADSDLYDTFLTLLSFSSASACCSRVVEGCPGSRHHAHVQEDRSPITTTRLISVCHASGRSPKSCNASCYVTMFPLLSVLNKSMSVNWRTTSYTYTRKFQKDIATIYQYSVFTTPYITFLQTSH